MKFNAVAFATLALAACLSLASPSLGWAQSGTITYLKQHGLLLLSDQNSHEISTANAVGTGKTLLTASGVMPSWTPDGKIIFTSIKNGAQIAIMNADGSNQRQIGQLDQNIMIPIMPQESRNGLIVFLAVTPSGAQSIWKMQSDGSGLKQLVSSGMNPSQPSLALSGTWITFTSETNAPYHREIWRINTDGTGQKQLTFLGDPDYPDANASVISPDETMVAFFSGKESDQGTAGFTQDPATWGHRNLAVIPANGGTRRTLTSCKPITEQAINVRGPSDCVAADNPAWSPDSKWILHDTDRAGIWMVDVNGQNWQLLYPTSRGTERVPLKYTN